MEAVSIVFTFLGGVLVFFLIVIWLFFSYLTKTKVAGTLSQEEEQTLEDIWKLSKRLEERVKSLEIILETETKGGSNES